MLSKVEPKWFGYVNDIVDSNRFKTDIKSLINNSELEVVFDNRIAEIISNNSTTTKDIGNIGESIIYSHE